MPSPDVVPLAPGRTAAELAVLLGLLFGAFALVVAQPAWRWQWGLVQAAAWLAFVALALALARSRRWRSRHDVLVVLAVAALLRAPLVPREPELSDDLWRYLWDGRVLASGVNPYAHAPTDPALAALRDTLVHPRINHPALRTIYPPLAEAGFALVGVVRPDAAGMKTWITLHDLLLCFVLARWCRERTGAAWAAIAYAWNPLVVLEYAGSGHHDPTGLLPLALAAWWAERRPRTSALAFAAAVLTKLLPLALLPVFWRRWPPAARAWAIGACAAGLAAFAALARGEGSGLEAYARSWRNNEFAFEFAARALGDPAARALAGALTLAVAGLAAWRGHELVRACRDTMRVALLAGPVLHPWYLGWALAWEPLAPSWPWLLLSALALLNYGVLAPPADGGAFHLPLHWRAVEYGAPLVLAGWLAWRRKPS